ncbi:MAG TPA: electron transfer flavoprotein subunit alpha/FixB family protein [Caldisericia bacterium]|nr:electron transfer flavoprotein subunit alpha/FixB family protein [Caldisericia bacterium]HPF48485.1 electron transfer flavoprotein subunit alpha/FixB family protein [Caldisericia bacterium]HPI83335.1 electron transfer flavoprotein subunit alpha/FixB family protein [Caldisericia bacterium]HPQ92939.1 electron transfer flavoprotein subunit alpha/FixB family protein [Caldisericia bacterium]HRV73963.1 electron transfer flavoprotein subunit alpha/FixB family protein [Caldisericia bacterium]
MAENTEWKDVLVFIEVSDGKPQEVGWELLGQATKLAGKLGQKVKALIIGKDVEKYAQEAVSYGADTVYVVDDPSYETYVTRTYCKAFCDVVTKHKPTIVLIGATPLGRDLSGAVGTILQAGLTADCTGLDIDDKTLKLLSTRPTFGGNIMATIFCQKGQPQMSTVRPKVMKKGTPDPARKGEIIKENIPVDPKDLTVKVLDFIPDKAGAVEIEHAKIIVAGGKGVNSPEGFEQLKKLADLLGGEVAGSRPMVEAGLLTSERQVGQTGKTVCPRVFIAVGISGAIQHLVGMQNSDVIISINSDPNAPIFKVSTVSIVEKWQSAIPKLIEQLEARIH